MIRLNLPKEPFWLELGLAQIRLLVHPPRTALIEAARDVATRDLLGLMDGVEAARAIGASVDGLPTGPGAEAGLLQELVARALAQHVIIDWDGVMTADGAAKAEVNAQTIADLMAFGPVARAFLARYEQLPGAVIAEGNGLAAAPAGTLVPEDAAATIATAAGA